MIYKLQNILYFILNLIYFLTSFYVFLNWSWNFKIFAVVLLILWVWSLKED
jgi:hypothetical protein